MMEVRVEAATMVTDNKGMEIDLRHPVVGTTSSRTTVAEEETTTTSTMVAVTGSVEAIWTAVDIPNLAEEDLEEKTEEEEGEEEAAAEVAGTTKAEVVEEEEDTRTTGMVVQSSILDPLNH